MGLKRTKNTVSFNLVFFFQIPVSVVLEFSAIGSRWFLTLATFSLLIWFYCVKLLLPFISVWRLVGMVRAGARVSCRQMTGGVTLSGDGGGGGGAVYLHTQLKLTP